jgi:lactoylglutathione lyase
MRFGWLSGAAVIAALSLGAHAEAQKSRSYDHVHFSVPDPEKAHQWYATKLGGVPGESPDRLTFGGMPWNGKSPLPVQLLWAKSPDTAKAVSGSAIENIAFSYADLAAKVKDLQAAGVTVLSPVAQLPGGWKRALIEDPWGVQIELLEDRDLIGFHHITLRVPDPEGSLKWYANEFGGERVKVRDGIEALRYDNVYLLVLKGPEQVLRPGFGLNHIGWAFSSIDAAAARLKADGVKFTAEPSATLNRYGHRIAFVEGPSRVRIEVVEHTKCPFSETPQKTSYR